MLPGWAPAIETLGSKRKFWFTMPASGGSSDWLFKYPARPASGEHWAEKVAAEVAALLAVPHARLELAEFQGQRGSITQSFLPNAAVELAHGNEVMEDAIGAGNFHHSHHTIGNIRQALSHIFRPPMSYDEVHWQFIQLLVLDGVISNADRHSENWGILRAPDGVSLAPSYDHGSSLGRELTDAARERRLAEDTIGRYSERGRGGIYQTAADRHGLSPLQVVRSVAADYPHLVHLALGRLGLPLDVYFQSIIARMPDGWMSDAAQSFALELMRYNRSELLKMRRRMGQWKAKPCS